MSCPNRTRSRCPRACERKTLNQDIRLDKCKINFLLPQFITVYNSSSRPAVCTKVASDALVSDGRRRLRPHDAARCAHRAPAWSCQMQSDKLFYKKFLSEIFEIWDPDSGFRIPDSGFRIPDSGLQIIEKISYKIIFECTIKKSSLRCVSELMSPACRWWSW